MSDIPVLAATASSEAVNSALAECGVVIVEDFIAPDVLEAFNAQVDSLLAAESGRSRVSPAKPLPAFLATASPTSRGWRANHHCSTSMCSVTLVTWMCVITS